MRYAADFPRGSGVLIPTPDIFSMSLRVLFAPVAALTGAAANLTRRVRNAAAISAPMRCEARVKVFVPLPIGAKTWLPPVALVVMLALVTGVAHASRMGWLAAGAWGLGWDGLSGVRDVVGAVMLFGVAVFA